MMPWGVCIRPTRASDLDDSCRISKRKKSRGSYDEGGKVDGCGGDSGGDDGDGRRRLLLLRCGEGGGVLSLLPRLSISAGGFVSS
mmetsp:Transcript_23398/g.56502  ORF Transcript_23398/g.56502 Transcript_23398/m.56502 type:complete len:85 (-) Transcript_23398:1-255(-)